MDIRAYIESGVIESYVLGIANEQEAAELEQLCRQYPEIRAAIDAFEASLEQNAMAHAAPLPAGIKEELHHKLFDDEPVPMRVSRPLTTYLAAAAIILLALSASINIYLYNQFRTAKDQYQALLVKQNSILADNGIMQTRMLDMYQGMQLMSDPGTIKVSMSGTGIHGKENNLATVFWDSKTKDVYLLANKLPPAGSGKQYQLWAIVNGKPVDAGMIDNCTGLCKMKNIPEASNFAITLEKKGGSPTPTLSQLQVIGKV